MITGLFLADHAGVYEDKLFVWGGVIDSLKADSLPGQVRTIAVALLDVTGRGNVEAPAETFQWLVIGPDGRQVDVSGSANLVGVAGWKRNAFMAVPLVIDAVRSGRHEIRATDPDGVSASVTVDIWTEDQ